MTAIRAAGPEDAAQLADLHAASFDRPWTEDTLRELLAAPGALALCADGVGTMVGGGEGFILVRRVLDEAEVLTLAVHPAGRRQGGGRALVEAVADLLALAGVVELRLEVAVDNVPARALYAAAGFEPTGRRRGYYAREGGAAPVDAVTLMRRLNSPPA